MLMNISGTIPNAYGVLYLPWKILDRPCIARSPRFEANDSMFVCYLSECIRRWPCIKYAGKTKDMLKSAGS